MIQVGFSIRYAKLKESVKSYKFWSSGIILKSPNNIMFSCVSRYMNRFLDKLSKNIDLLWSGGLNANTISLFLKQWLIRRKRFSLKFLREFSCSTGMLSLIYLHRPTPELFLSCLNIPCQTELTFSKRAIDFSF